MNTLALLLTLAVAALMVIDLLQTILIAENPHRWSERNPLARWVIQRSTTESITVNLSMYFGAAFVLTVVLSLLAGIFIHPTGFSIVLGLVTAAEVVCVVNNFRIGLNPFNFKSL